MIVIVLTACPEGLRGLLTRWLLEISPGVFVGHLPARVRDHLWERIEEGAGRGRAIMVFSARSEQHLDFRVHGHDWRPVTLDGFHLMLRPGARDGTGGSGQGRFSVNPPRGWSVASRHRAPRPR